MRGTRRHRAGALLRRLCAGLLALAATAVSVPAGADRIIGIQAGPEDAVTLGSSNDAAQAFTTGTYPQTGIMLTSIEISIQIGAGTTLPTMTLRTGSAAGTAVATLTTTETVAPNSFNNIGFTPSMTTKLAARTTYWVVLEGGSDDLGWRYTNADTDSHKVGGATAADVGETRLASSTGSYTARSNGAFRFQVNGEPDIPQPPDPGRVLVHNLDQKATDVDLELEIDTEFAQVFRTGGTTSSRYNLDSIELGFGGAISSADITSKLAASVWSINTSGNLNTKQYDLEKPTSAIGPMEVTNDLVVVGPAARFTAPANTVLNGNTRYAVVVSYDGDINLFTVESDTETSSAGFTLHNNYYGRGRSDNWDTGWSTQSLLMRVNGAVQAANNPPTVANAIPDQSAPAGTEFNYAFPDTTFTDANSDMLTYMAMKADGNPLPTWLTFAATTRTFSGMPAAADVGTTVAVKVTASDGNGGSVSDEFNIVVVAAHCNPSNTNELWCANVTVGTAVLGGVTYTGYSSVFNTYGSIAPATFTYRTATIGARSFEYNDDNTGFDFGIERVAGTTPPDGLLGSGIFTLEIGAGGDKHSFVTNNPGRTRALPFRNPGLSWSVGDTVPFKLVWAPNTVPTSADSTVTVTEDTDYTFPATDFAYTDPDTGAQLSSVKIVSLPASGTLTLSGTEILSGDLPKTVLLYDLNTDQLKYSPPANENGASLASFTFRVNDGGDDSATANTLTIDVTAVNDAATGKPGITGTAQVGQTLTATAWATSQTWTGCRTPF